MKQTKFKAKKSKKEAQKKQKRADKISGRILITGMILFIILMIFSPPSVGYDSRFIMFIILLPIALGTIPLLIYQSKLTEALGWTSDSGYEEMLWEKIV